MSRKPTRKPGSRRGGGTYRGVGPERLPIGLYLVELVMVCKADGTEMGRAIRYTAEGMDGDTETRPVPGTGGALPRQDNPEGFEKWLFECITCGHSVPKNDEKLERLMDEITAPWARRSVRVPL